MNAGIGGESAWDIKDRLDYDVFDRKPTYVTLTFGLTANSGIHYCNRFVWKTSHII